MTVQTIATTGKRFILGVNFFVWFVSRVIGGWCGLFRATFPSELRKRFEQLGATYIKFGQVLAMRPDITPPRFVAELEALLDAVPSFPSEKAISIVEKELGAPISELFSNFDLKPVGSASFAQVHFATLHDGSKVAVKIQRPDLPIIVMADLRFLRFLVLIVDGTSLLNRIKLKDVYLDFSEWTLQELDLEQEGAFIERFHKADLPTAVYPKVFWKLTSRRVLTMSFFEGRWLTDVLKAIEVGDEEFLAELDLKCLARNLFQNALFQFFDLGIFNADPHAGNMCVFNSNLIGYVDFGIVGQIDSNFRAIQIDVLDALQREDLDDYYDALFRLLNPPPEDVDMDGFQRAVKSNARTWLNSQYKPISEEDEADVSLHERSSATLFSRNFLCARRFGVSFSELSARYYRAAAVLELILFRLDPQFEFREGLKIFFSHYRNRQLLSRVSPAQLSQAAFSFGSLFADMPYTLSLLQDALYETRTDIRTAVNGVQRFFSHCFKAFGWILLLLPLLLWVGMSAGFFKFLGIVIEFRIVVYLLPVGAVLLWLSRHLRIGSVQPNRRIRGREFSR